MRKLPRARFRARMCGGIPEFHGLAPVATRLDRFAVRGGVSVQAGARPGIPAARLLSMVSSDAHKEGQTSR